MMCFSESQVKEDGVVVLVITLKKLGGGNKELEKSVCSRGLVPDRFVFFCSGKKVKGQDATQLGSESTENSCGSLYSLGCGKHECWQHHRTHLFKGKWGQPTAEVKETVLSPSPHAPHYSSVVMSCRFIPGERKTIYANDFLLHWLAPRVRPSLFSCEALPADNNK